MNSYEMEFGGRKLVIETGELAGQANGSVLVRYGDTVVLVTATASKEPREGIDFFPLLVDFEERLYSVGKIPGGFIKREGRPSEAAILSARLIDRPLRPLFPKGFRNDVQVVATVMSVNQDNAPDITAMIGASAALTISDIPFNGPIAGTRVGLIDGQFIINPSTAQREDSQLDLVVAGTKDAVMMVEAGAKEVTEEVMLEAILFGHEEIKRVIAFQEEMAREIGEPKKEFTLYTVEPDIETAIRELGTDLLRQAIQNPDKQARQDAIDQAQANIKEQYLAKVGEEQFALVAKKVSDTIDSLIKEMVRSMIVNEGIRPDGRKPDEVRPISSRVGVLPRTHGSGLFQRGQTQVLTVATLGIQADVQILDGLGVEEFKRYMHHYNFPSYSVGEVRPMRGPGRREIGHGALAERALVPVLPAHEDFPYTIRLVSEVLSSNGSTSQASVCGSTLALMDAGVPITKPVAGVAMGLIKEGEQFAVLTDIQGMEDHLGDMDFKVAGTKDGITAIQMDIKIAGIGRDILTIALSKAKVGRMFIMNKMLEALPEPRKEMSPYAPRIITLSIDPEKIRDVIGPGGKTIRKIIAETGADIDIEDDGHVFIASVDLEAGAKAKAIIEGLTKEVEVGEVYEGVVKRITTFGAFVEIGPNKEGLVHISKLAKHRVEKVEDVVKLGDTLTVKVTEIDNLGRINLSHKEFAAD